MPLGEPRNMVTDGRRSLRIFIPFMNGSLARIHRQLYAQAAERSESEREGNYGAGEQMGSPAPVASGVESSGCGTFYRVLPPGSHINGGCPMVRLILTAFLLTCSVANPNVITAADVSGEVFLVLKSGEIRRGAGLSVVITPMSSSFSQQWTQVLADCSRDFGAAKSAEDRAERIDNERQAAAVRNWPSADAQNAQNESMRRHYAAMDEVLRVNDQYSAIAADVIRQHSVASSPTDSTGRYLVPGVIPGPVFVFTRMPLANNTYYWMILANVKQGGTRVDLTEQNKGWEIDQCHRRR